MVIAAVWGLRSVHGFGGPTFCPPSRRGSRDRRHHRRFRRRQRRRRLFNSMERIAQDNRDEIISQTQC